jgi:uncharacterized FlaG/YvyC family protein
MEINSSRPVEGARVTGILSHGSQSPKNSQGLIGQTVQAPSESPDSGGVVAASEAESGKTQNPTADRNTRDRSALVELIQHLADNTGGPGNTRLSIEVNEATDETRFLIISKTTGEVLKTIPPEDLLTLMHDLDTPQGTLVDRRL